MCVSNCSHPSMPDATENYVIEHGWPRLPEGEKLGAVSGVGVDSHDHVFVFHRAGRLWPESNILSTEPIDRPTIWRFDGHSGELLDQWGAHCFAMPHGLTVDHEDNLWLTDLAWQQVFKYSPEGELLLTLGERGVAGTDGYHFNRPTAVAVASDGSFYVSDGYINSRVLKFRAQGQFLFEWGSKGAAPGEFNLPHNIALDCGGLVYVSDRSNARVQIFNGQGGFLREWKSAIMGRPYALAFRADGLALVVDGGDQPRTPPHRSGVTAVNKDGQFGPRFGRFGNYDGQFDMAHDIAIASNGAVYVGDINGARVQKFLPRKMT
jgi:peptidylamidoglycolate lyase